MGIGVKLGKSCLTAALSALVWAVGAWAQVDTATVPFTVNTPATLTVECTEATVPTTTSSNSGTIRANLKIPVAATSSVSYRGAQGLNAPVITNSGGKITLNLPAQSYKSAEISLHSVNGRRVLSGRADGSGAAKSISRQNIASGVYLLSVKGVNGGAFSTRLSHRGGKLSVNVAIGEVSALSKSAAVGDPCTITITPTGTGYKDTTISLSPTKAGLNDTVKITLRQDIVVVPPVDPPNIAKKDYTETVGSVSFDMIYIPGGTFTLGCESGCSQGAAPVKSGVTVSNYFIMKTEVSTALWNAVMGKTGGSASSSYASATWYDAFDFACKLSQLTGKNYRIMTEAEFEYAAKKPNKSGMLKVGDASGINGEEWAYNSWDADNHTGGTDPVGPSSGEHTQKTRRDANVAGENSVTARLIRSIDGTGPSTRLVVSADVAYPPNYVPSCDIHAPKLDGEAVNSYRDPLWVTGSDSQWSAGSIAIGSISLSVWEDGTAKLGSANGQWFTSNDFTFVFVPTSGSIIKYAYIFLDDKQGSVIGEKALMSAGGYIGRIVKKTASVTKPAVSGLMAGEALAKAQTNFATEFKMVNMENIPTADRKQDSRLLDGGDTKGWFQDNTSMKGEHHYRKDIDPDAFRFTVNQNNGRTPLSAGTWFTVNNTFLRVTHSNGYVADYLYTISSDGTFYHNSYIGYERADFRMFKKETNGSSWPKTNCGNICSEEIPKNITPVPQTGYLSTYKPPKCPSGGCN